MTPEPPSYRRRPVSRVGEELPGSFEDQGLQRGSGLMRLVSPAGEVLLLVLPRRSTQEEVAPTASPGLRRGLCAAQPQRGAAELGPSVLRQSSPLFPLRLALLDDAKGMRKTTPISTVRSIRFRLVCFASPSCSAEQRSRAGGSRRGLSEGRSPEFRSRPAC